MTSNPEAVRKAVFDAIYEIVPDPDTNLDEQVDLIAGFGLDSEDGIDFAIRLSKKLGWGIPPDVNPFWDDAGKRSRTLGEIIGIVVALVPQEAAHA